MKHHRTAFTLIELLIVVGVIGLLVGLLLPALSKAREAAKQTTCASNLRQIVIAVHHYSRQNKDTIPAGPGVNTGNPFAPTLWDQIATNQIFNLAPTPLNTAHGSILIDEYMPEPKMMFCPGDDTIDGSQELAHFRAKDANSYSSYLYRNKDQTTHDKIDDLGVNGNNLPARALILDFNRYNPVPPAGNQYLHNNTRVNVGFLDGHVSTFENTASMFNLRAMDFAAFPTSVEARFNTILTTSDALQ